jgi:hypothetical protein
VPVDRGIISHQHADIGDGDEDFNRAIGHRLGNRELIQIARRVVVNLRPEQPAQIANRGAGRHSSLRDVVGLGHRCR